MMPGRKFTRSNSNYRYSINGQEKETELNENITTAEYWEYDSRIVRRWNIDPVRKEYESPYLCFSGNPIVFADPDGDDPITGIVEALTSFALDVGMDFFTSFVIEGKSASESFDNIGWWSAGWGAVKSYAVAVFTPPGTSTARKVAKLANSTAGKIVIGIVEKMVTKAMDNYNKGLYNDDDGDFDFDNVSLKELFWESTIETLVEQGLGSRADAILEKLKKENKKLFEKIEKLKKKAENNESQKRINNYSKVVNKQKEIVKKQTVKLVKARVVDKVQSKAIAGGINKIREKVKGDKTTDKKASQKKCNSTQRICPTFW
jgi:hypothetical protein